jgi:hypothetical protein
VQPLGVGRKPQRILDLRGDIGLDRGHHGARPRLGVEQGFRAEPLHHFDDHVETHRVPVGAGHEPQIFRTNPEPQLPADIAAQRLIRAIAAAAKAEPSLNAWYNSQAGERRLIPRIDVGIAIDTEGGLIVPVMRNVGERDANDLPAGLDRMRVDAAARSIPPDELRGATITLSNFGMIGGRFAQLAVVPPQVAIIGAGRIAPRVMVHAGSPAVRRVLPLSLTFDHRVVTGGEAARFLMALKRDLERAA